MRCVAFEPVLGASGDMILGALFDLGADPDAVARDLRAAGLDDFHLHFSRDPGAGRIAWGRCDVRTDEHHHHAAHAGHAAGEAPAAASAHSHHHHPHAHRKLREILAFIAASSFADRVKARASAIFGRLADAEAAVHGVPPEQVHFHEVGATDALVDIIGACLALEQLGAETVFCAPFKVGTGFIQCAHGTLPNPAPATVRLLEGFPVVRLPIEAELTTPTGAAVLTALSAGDWSGMPCRWLKTGGGLGQRQLAEGPNLLRAYLMEVDAPADYVEVLETEIDDDSPEAVAAAAELLRQQGALDVTLTPVQMKKGRVGTRLTVLARAGEGAAQAGLMLQHTSSIGVRCQTVRRFTLARRAATVATPWGELAAKRIERAHGVEFTPEFEAARELSATTGVPVRQILQAGRRWEPKSTGAG